MIKVASLKPKTSTHGLIIKLFNSALKKKNTLNFAEVNKFAVKLGYLVHPDLCSDETLEYLKSQSVDYNSTFYKKWSSVINKNRFELLLDQLMHYASTYGTNFTGEPYLPNEVAEVPPFNTFKVILPITKEDLIKRCNNMLSGIALSQTTIEDLLAILTNLNALPNIELVKNREAKMFLYKKTGTVPNNAIEMVRYLVYLATEKTLLIKDGKTLAAIKASKLDISELILDFGADELSSVFHRFKPIFLEFKKANKYNAKLVNRLRRLANTNHEPMKIGFFERLLSDESTLKALPGKLSDITNFKKVLLLQTINIRMKELTLNAYVIRNQKLYIKEGKKNSSVKHLGKVYSIIYANLVQELSHKACDIALPEGINLTIPTSEKSFIGNFPLGTSFDLSKHNAIVGINWRGIDGARDLDLSLMSIDGTKYGWNAAFKNDNNSIVFSGDMTYAEPEATELFYASKGFNPCIVKVNNYSGEMGSKFRFFLAKEKITNLERNYMVDPNNILTTVECEMDSKEKSLGVITENKFILANFRTGSGRVSYRSITDLYTDYALSTLDCYLSLRNLLEEAGFNITNENPNIDLTNLSKDTLIDLFS